MTVDQEIAQIAALIGDQTRSAILIALMEGRALTAGELALRANISPQTASNHLKKLVTAKLIVRVPMPTRYHYYKIDSPLVAKALESLSLLTSVDKKRPPRHERLDQEICFARTCYDHLAGTLGVKMREALQQKGYISLKADEFIITKKGQEFFEDLNIDCNELKKQRRHFANSCLDWTEREFHLAGSLGKALLDYLLNHRLLLQAKNKPRVIILTEKGRQWLRDVLTVK